MHKIGILLAFPEIPESALPVISMPQGNDIQEPHKEHPADEGRYIMLMEGGYCDPVHSPPVTSRSIVSLLSLMSLGGRAMSVVSHGLAPVVQYYLASPTTLIH